MPTTKVTQSRINLMGVEIDNITQKELIENIIFGIEHNNGGWILTPNTDILRSYHTQKNVKKYFKQATYLIPDGTPLMWASQILGTPFREKIPGSRLFHPLTKALSQYEYKILLLGGNDGLGEQAKVILEQTYPGIKICPPICPPMGFEKDPSYFQALKDIIAQQSPDFIYVCLSFPKGEMLIENLRTCFPSIWFMNCGITLSYLTGEIKQAPQWLNNIGGEWILRLIQEPRRLFKRYIIDDIPFCIQLLLHSVLTRFHLLRT